MIATYPNVWNAESMDELKTYVETMDHPPVEELARYVTKDSVDVPNKLLTVCEFLYEVAEQYLRLCGEDCVFNLDEWAYVVHLGRTIAEKYYCDINADMAEDNKHEFDYLDFATEE
jgi:hypothetical protein